MRYVRGAVLGCAMLSIAACSHATQSAPQSHPRIAPRGRMMTPAPPISPSSAQSRAATATPQPAPRALPPAVVKHVVRLPPNAAPKILAVAMNETTVHHGDRVLGNVVTTSNVASVQARIGGYAMTLNKTGVGRFALAYTVNIPWFVHGNFDLHVIATNTHGASVERVIPLIVR